MDSSSPQMSEEQGHFVLIGTSDQHPGRGGHREAGELTTWAWWCGESSWRPGKGALKQGWQRPYDGILRSSGQ